ncbi:MAG: hypothetical protein K8I60_08490 [Anaerolineae bacterium]|nr:hypothetical protein [Anaerolineae bacterium]
MTTQVVILYSQSLFAAGVESRLRSIEGLTVTRVDASDKMVLELINSLIPDVIIIDEQDTALVGEVLIPQVFSQNPSLRLVGLNLNSREINIYRREGRAVLTGDDLAEAIRNQPSG